MQGHVPVGGARDKIHSKAGHSLRKAASETFIASGRGRDKCGWREPGSEPREP